MIFVGASVPTLTLVGVAIATILLEGRRIDTRAAELLRAALHHRRLHPAHESEVLARCRIGLSGDALAVAKLLAVPMSPVHGRRDLAGARLRRALRVLAHEKKNSPTPAGEATD